MFHIKEIDHLVLRVVDLPAMLVFYRDVLGCTLERVEEDAGLYQLRAGRSLIDLVPLDRPLGAAGGAAPGAQGRNMEHFCLTVEPFDEQALLAYLREHKLESSDVEQRYGAQGFGPSVYIRDPEGNVIELKGPPEREQPVKPSSSMAEVGCEAGLTDEDVLALERAVDSMQNETPHEPMRLE